MIAWQAEHLEHHLSEILIRAQTFKEEEMRIVALFCCVSIESTKGMKERFSGERAFVHTTHTDRDVSLFLSDRSPSERVDELLVVVCCLAA